MLRASCAALVVASAAPVSADTASPALELGFSGGLFFPASDHEFFDVDEAAQEPLDGIASNFDVRLGLFPLSFVGVEGEAGYITANLDTRDARLNLTSFRAHLIVQLPLPVAVFALAGVGGTLSRSPNDVLGDDVDRVFHVGTGAKMNIHDNIQLRVDGRVYRAPRFGDGDTDHFAVTAGVAINIGAHDHPQRLPVDPDGDGVIGAADRCPDQAGVEPTGCPAEKKKPVDSDKDGFVDADDACPERPETANGYQDDDGCPDELPDTDSDGIDDTRDGCVSEPEDLDGHEDSDGCPDPDNDADGVVDASDSCPREAGPVENRGCPDTDRDGDSVVDRLDNCPDEPGTRDNQGCKKKQMVVLTRTKIEILDKVYFRTNRARLRRRSFPLLSNIANVLKVHPEILKVRIEGHTDDRGKDARNLELSQKRAKAVADFLIGKGVEPERVEAVGLGETAPVADNKTREGRAANRRVEFKILETAPLKTP